VIKTITKHELLDNILSFKFAACVLVAIVLAVGSTIFQASNYLDRLSDFSKGDAAARNKLTQVPAYSFLRIEVYKKPPPLSIFVSGIESRAGNFVILSHREIPISLQGGRASNEFASIFSFFDFPAIVVGVFSVLAILLAYGSISGEKETGMLSMALSNSVPRSRYLAGKYLGGITALAVAMLFCFLTGAMVLVLHKGVDIGSGFFLSLFVIYVFSLMYLSVVLLFAMLVSSLTKSSPQSLVIILAFYLISVYLLPIGINTAADGASARKAVTYDRNVGTLVSQRQAQIEQTTKAIPARRTWTFMRATEGMNNALLGRLNPPETIAHFERLFELTERLREDYALKIYALHQEDSRIRERIDRIRNLALAFLPASSFGRAVELETETGREGLDRFFNQVTTYWYQYVRYLDEKDAFSLIYSYPYPRELSQADRSLVDEVSRFSAEGREPFWKSPAFREIGKRNAQYEKDIKPLDLSDLPVFMDRPASFAERLTKWLPSVLILVIYNLLLFALAYFAFVRYDPRMEI
jgi:ABC-type transport system involved in multi-copper enzyme maturation permease subunit